MGKKIKDSVSTQIGNYVKVSDLIRLNFHKIMESTRLLLNVLNNKESCLELELVIIISRVYSQYGICKRVLDKLRNFEPGVNNLYLMSKAN